MVNVIIIRFYLMFRWSVTRQPQRSRDDPNIIELYGYRILFLF